MGSCRGVISLQLSKLPIKILDLAPELSAALLIADAFAAALLGVFVPTLGGREGLFAIGFELFDGHGYDLKRVRRAKLLCQPSR